ncbi:MAG: flagellar biosynthesis protein FlhF [Panacagrimonas sp.]
MKIKRFVAPNMREAMRLVRESQGPDAVILSNRRVEGGIEVVSATDYDAAMMQSAAIRSEPVGQAPIPGPELAEPTTPPEPPPGARPNYQPYFLRQEAIERDARQRATESAAIAAANIVLPAVAEKLVETPRIYTVPFVTPDARSGDRRSVEVSIAAAMPPATSSDTKEIDGLKSELQDLRRFMEQKLATVARPAVEARKPIRADVLRSLVDIGIELKLAREVAAEIPEGASAEHARSLAMGLIARRIPAFRHEWLDTGGVIALVGATGVGKTTTIAKLAARYVQSWGLRDVALVTTDHFRIGAQEQLFTYGRLLGVPVLTADNPHELGLALDKLRDRKLVLIDTAGMSPRDANLEKQFAMLSGLTLPHRTALVLSASSQGADLDDQFARFAASDPNAVILTKLDEATRLGTAISAIVRKGLPLAYVADGQRVPEDLAAANPEQLMQSAMDAMHPNNDEAFSNELAGVAHA